MSTQHHPFAKAKLPDKRRTPSSHGSWDARPEPSWRRSGPKAKVARPTRKPVSPLVALGFFAVGVSVGAIVARSMGLI